MKKKKGFSSIATVITILAIALAVFVAYSLGTKKADHNLSDELSTQTPDDVSSEVNQASLNTDASSSQTSSNEVSVNDHTYTIDTTKIPLGDGKVTTSPKVGYVYSCQTSFNGGGAFHAGDWISGDTWNLQEKISVKGSVSWPNATFGALLEGMKRLLSGNGLPVDSKTGTFPIASTDPAYEYDRNPNSIQIQNVSYELPGNPTVATTPSCVPMGPVGVALNGVAIYNALDDAGRDAVAHEVQDECSGHPQQAGQYHYHGPSDCMPHADENNALVGYALDGFGIFSRFDATGKEYTNADLDECHGITSEIMWDGQKVSMYHYVLTEEYPYTIGCFRGTPVVAGHGSTGQTGQNNQNQTGGGTPPQAAINACSGKSANSGCSFSGGQGTISGTCRNTPDGSFACVPQ